MKDIDRSSTTNLYTQIYEGIRQDIESGDLVAGEKLTPIRRLAHELHVSRNTVEMAYQQLLTEGFVKSRTGSGYVVNDVEFMRVKFGEAFPAASSVVPKGTSIEAVFAEDPYNTKSDTPYDFTYGDRSPKSFPSRTWRLLTDEVLETVGGRTAQYGNAWGEPGLRIEIARWLRRTRSVDCTADQIVILPGTQPAVDSILTLFNSQFDIVGMEDPGYRGVRDVFRNRGFTVVPLPAAIGGEMEPNVHFTDALQASNAKLVFLTPSVQFPTGSLMPILTRIRTLRWAMDNDAFIIEDDYCREFLYSDRPLQTLQSMDTDGRVIYLGTMSKMLSPALRVSYMVLPQRLMSRWKRAHEQYYCPVPWLTQEVLRLYMARGYWTRNTRRVTAEYEAIHALVMESLDREMGDRIDILGGTAGLYLLVRTKDGRTQEELIRLAAQQDVRVYPTRLYCMQSMHGMDGYVLLGFSAIEKENVAEGIRRLRVAWFGEDSGQAT
ncbi:HTH-type transcriptional regulatory protein gabR [Slackia heliotrinireducens]|uniref:Transcriptional regulator with HTH domain and aminotransferase domain n=1 Tax=Slackia heliotrinireducens (strain ATCC 29202 / DSM 20476 / NCTC 11029 / RHS 1) TaxID=471855 RepID=C7N4H8_SLAHD|nr:PLP-dependent aminotransferase family protein [Slackia heliotrinireducens]ACV21813.1 transcriptional regulator with HTH domain and aminotransferase domain [Slackia heliotrinireducens DSM 20476]VEG99523.1 HTH-type transcriptional regulatory protein gabR [Slackia heliotrinireducens]